MESLSETTWDVVLCGTGLPQSLLALALSRSDKKVLHLDKNDYYGSLEAALSLQEIETWAETVNGAPNLSPFRHATIENVEKEKENESKDKSPTKLGFSRAYSLSLSPQIIYTRSNLLPALVSSKVYRQLEFLAVGSWWLYSKDGNKGTEKNDSYGTASRNELRKIPGGREDIFADKSIDRRSMMSLMRFLKLAADPEAHALILDEWGQRPFFDFLERQFKIPPSLQELLHSLTLSSDSSADTSTYYALPKVHRHLTSIGQFGPGFGAVIPKWGGLAEVAQVACRAGAVGGGVYVLKKGIRRQEGSSTQAHAKPAIRFDHDTQLSSISLDGGDEVKSRWVVGSSWDFPHLVEGTSSDEGVSAYVVRSITIVSGTLPQLFPISAEGAPPPAGAIIVLPIRTLRNDYEYQALPFSKTDPPPVYLMVHSSDTGECPMGQCIIYAHTFQRNHSEAREYLRKSVQRLLESIEDESPPQILWTIHYDQIFPHSSFTEGSAADLKSSNISKDNVLRLPDLGPGLALEDDVLKFVRIAYQRIMGADGTGFMTFEDREGGADDEVND